MDLVLKGGRVIDPANQLDAECDIGFENGKVARLGSNLSGAVERDVRGQIVCPGLIDLHTHVYWGGTSLGIDADDFCRTCGVTTSVDTGSAGPGNFAGFRRHVIEHAETRILAYLHVSFAGIYGFGKEVHVGESCDIRLMAPVEAAEVADKNRDVIVGIKIRLGRHASGDQGMAPFEYALDVAEETGLPIMAHIDEAPPSYGELVDRLRPGDILTHCFRPFPNSPVVGQGRIRDEVIAARKRGVFFDVGHGMGSFSFRTARTMLAQGFMPDTISSDIHQLCINGPAYDQTVTMSKFLCLGVELNDVIAASTIRAAEALRRPELGNFSPGSVGDATVLEVREGSFPYEDVVGEVLEGKQRIFSRGVVLGGKWWWTGN
ncbi:amidohydrolase/deacetylase family metallohydrolase [Rhodobacteraceae bacterium NNCM2]|nr:amidohydrolase/deacetylase family metallohydrolase [Coraliihabitans acroporae]